MAKHGHRPERIKSEISPEPQRILARCRCGKVARLSSWPQIEQTQKRFVLEWHVAEEWRDATDEELDDLHAF